MAEFPKLTPIKLLKIKMDTEPNKNNFVILLDLVLKNFLSIHNTMQNNTTHINSPPNPATRLDTNGLASKILSGILRLEYQPIKQIHFSDFEL